MDDLRLQAVAARVVAWHNRHPLARRISLAQVRSVGYVALSVGTEPATPPPDPASAPADSVSASLPAGAPTPGLPEADYSAAFAALAEHPQPGEPAAVASLAATATATASTVAAPEIEFDVAGADAGGAAAAAPAPSAALGADPAAGADTAAADAAAVDVATVTAPGPAASPQPQPPLHIPTLRDRVQTRTQQPAVQGALLATHDGYRPTLHPQAAVPASTGLSALVAAEPGDGDRFMAPLSPRELARWVARHGRSLLQPPLDGPIRRVSTAVVAKGPAAGTTYVLTAAIAGGGLSSRVLVGAGSPAAVLGARLWSLPRLAAAAMLAALLLAAAAVAVVSGLRPAAPTVAAEGAHGDAPAAAAASAAAASAPAADLSSVAARAAAAVPATAASASANASAAGAAPTAAAAAASAPAAPEPETQEHRPAAAASHGLPAEAQAPPEPELALTAARPLPAYARKGPVVLPVRGLPLSEDDKAAARAAVAAARAGRPPAPPRARAAQPEAEAPEPAAQAGQAKAPPVAARAEAPASPVFAISTRSLRTRAEAEQLQAAITALLAVPGSSGRHVDLLPEGDDWRVVAWPFSSQAEADRARALLTGRAMKVEVMRF